MFFVLTQFITTNPRLAKVSALVAIKNEDRNLAHLIRLEVEMFKS